MKAYSDDLRQRVLEAAESGQETARIAVRFDVSPAWVRRIKQRWREEHSIAPRPAGGDRRSRIDEETGRWLGIQVHHSSDATLEELRVRLAQERGVDVSVMTVWRALRKLGYTLVKGTSGPARWVARGR